MATKTLRRSALIGSASLLALAFGAGGPAMAQTQTDVTIDLLGLNVSGTISAVNGNPINSIASQGIIQSPAGSSLSVGVTNNSIAGDVYLDITPGPTVADSNLIFAAASGNTYSNSVGLLPAGADGAAILQGQVADGLSIRAHSNGDQIIEQVFDNGDGSTEFNSNSIFTDAAINRSLNTIEVDSTADLTIPADAGYLDSGLPSSQQQASLSIVNVQLSTNFDNADVSGDPIADIVDATVQFNRETDVVGGEVLFGTFNLTGNSIKSTANANSSDNSVLVGDGDAPSFGGTAFVTNVQASDDSNEVGVGAQVAGAGNTITFEFRQDALGGTEIGSAESLIVVADDNVIASRAVVNSSRNEVSFDGDLTLEGILVEPSQQIIRLTSRAPDRVEADYAAVNIQAAASLFGGTSQGAYALTDSASIALTIEDVAATSNISFDGNDVTATAGGNSALNIVGNGAGGTSPSVSAVSANLNYQLIDTPLIDATVSNALVVTNIGVLQDGSEAFGGFDGSSLSFSDNGIKAASFGNAAQAETSFQALALTMQFSDNGGVDPNDGANLNSNNGEAADVGDYRATAGAATLSYQLLTGALSADPVITAAVEDSILTLLANGYSYPNLAAASLGGLIDANGNLLSASAVGNSFNGSTTLDGTASVTGSAGTLAYQGATGQSVAADLFGSGLDVFLGYGPSQGATNLTLSVSVSENLLLSFASVNALSTSTLVTGLDLEGGADGNDSNARIYGSLDLSQIAGRNRARGDASVTILSDQANGEGGASAEARDVFLAVQVIDMGNGSAIADSGITIDANTILAQSRGNQAANGLEIDVQSATNAQEGALAGIISQQVNGTTAAPTVDPNDPEATVASLVYAGSYGNEIAVNANNLDSSTLSVQQNRILANAAANSVSNDLAVQVSTSLDLTTSSVTGAELAVSVVGTTSDVQLDIIASGAYILNSQRNEALNPGAVDAPDAAGPAVLAIVSGSGASPANSIVVNVGVTDGNAVVGSTLSSGIDVNANGILATARANDASNTLGLDIGNGAANGGILNNQINSGEVAALNDGSSITTNLLGVDNDGVFVTMNGNQIGSSSLGNNVSNQLNAAATTGFSGVAGSVGPVATIPAGTGVLINNGALDATGNLVVLNTQTTYGVTGLNESSATTSNATIALNANAGATLGSAVSFSNNSIGATVGANTASNSIVASAGVGDLPSATIVSVQKSSGVALSANVSDSTISATLGDVGGTGGYSGSLTMSGNKIGATGSINSGSNTISAPGQTFTRTSTF